MRGERMAKEELEGKEDSALGAADGHDAEVENIVEILRYTLHDISQISPTAALCVNLAIDELLNLSLQQSRNDHLN
jgi:hypothetical protein